VVVRVNKTKTKRPPLKAAGQIVAAGRLSQLADFHKWQTVAASRLLQLPDFRCRQTFAEGLPAAKVWQV